MKNFKFFIEINILVYPSSYIPTISLRFIAGYKYVVSVYPQLRCAALWATNMPSLTGLAHNFRYIPCAALWAAIMSSLTGPGRLPASSIIREIIHYSNIY